MLLSPFQQGVYNPRVRVWAGDFPREKGGVTLSQDVHSLLLGRRTSPHPFLHPFPTRPPVTS